MASLLQGKGWIADADRFLTRAATQIRLLAAVTPTNARAEHDRLVQAYEHGEIAAPNWTYPSVDAGELVTALYAVAEEIERADDPLARLYAARAREMGLEAELASAAGQPRFAALATLRFRPNERDAAAAEAFCESWPGLTAEPEASVPTEQLEEAMKRAVGELRLPFTVTRDANLHALAATGDTTIYVSAHARVTQRDITRTVVHETIGHALPRHRAAFQTIGIFRLGTAQGADDQEGYALLIEDRNGMLDGGRKRELACRHRAACEMERGASFTDVVGTLLAYGLHPHTAISTASRVFRGSNGTTRGLGRERTYLEAYARVTRALHEDASCEKILASGQVAAEAIGVLRDYWVQPDQIASSASR